MRSIRSLESEFPDAHTHARITLSRPNTRVDIDGPFDELVSDLLLFVATIGCNRYGDEERDAMRTCLAVLNPPKDGDADGN